MTATTAEPKAKTTKKAAKKDEPQVPLTGIYFSCSQGELNSHLQLVSKAISNRPARPVLGNVLVKVDEEKQAVILIGFDESLGIQTSFEASVVRGGEITLPHKLVGDIVSRLEGDLSISELEDDCGVAIAATSGRYQVRGLSSEDYPCLPEVDDSVLIELSRESLLQGLTSTLYCVSTDETKQVLTGVHVRIDPDQIEFAATDGHRLGVIKLEEDEESGKFPDALMTIPGKALAELNRMLAKSKEETVTLKADTTQAVFQIGEHRLTSRLLEGQYPNYRQLVPKQFSRQATCDRVALASALERVAVLADHVSDTVKFSFENSTVTVSANASEVGSGCETVSVQLTGGDIDIAFNVKYVLSALKNFQSTEICINMNGATNPVVLTPLGAFSETALIMPVQIRE